MFPLGTVLVPKAVVPLHVFEPRYQTMLVDVMAGDRKFGVVLIERGSEVGGGDVRTDVGTAVQVVELRPIAASRWVVVVAGTERITVDRWLSDDPYPRAEVSAFPDEPGPSIDAQEWKALKRQMRQVLAALAELGDTVARATFELGDDPVMGSFQLASLGPFSDLDRQRVLCTPGVSGRCALLTELLSDVAVLARLRLGSSEEADGSRG
jgi:Lon protease-like protein